MDRFADTSISGLPEWLMNSEVATGGSAGTTGEGRSGSCLDEPREHLCYLHYDTGLTAAVKGITARYRVACLPPYRIWVTSSANP